MNSWLLSPDAQIDLDDVWDYIAEDNIEAADHWVARIFDAFDQLARNSHMGHIRTDLTSHSIRFWPVGAYLILYRPRTDGIEIVAVTQGTRDIPSFLHSRLP